MILTPQDVKSRSASDMSSQLRRLLASATLSSVGDGLVIVALGLLALEATDDARLVAAVFAAERLPWLLGQVIASRADRHPAPARLLVLADLLRAATLAIAAIAAIVSEPSIPVLLVLAAALGFGTMVHGAARHVVLAELAEGTSLAKANGYLGAAEGLGYAAVGPAIGGVIYSVGRVVPLIGDAASFLISAWLTRPLTRRRRVVEPRPEHGRDGPGAGRTVLNHPLLALLFAQIMVLGFAQSIVLAVTPVFLRGQLRLSTGWYGLFLGAAAIGGLATSVLTPHLWVARRHTHSFLSGASVVAGLCYLALSNQTLVLPALALLFVFDGTVGIIGTILPTLRLEHSPTDRRARVGALFSQAVLAGQPIGALISGGIAQAYGVRRAFEAAGCLILLVSVPLALPLRRAIRAAGA